MRNNVTMRDIANKLDVSSVTVSKALNDKEGVSAELKEKIKQLAEEMGYRYNITARTMKDGLTYNIGVVIPEKFTRDQQSFYLNVYQYLSKHLEALGYYGILHILTHAEEKSLSLPRVYYEKRVDGFIILGQTSKSYIELLEHIELPKIFMDFYDERSEVDSVITDNFYGAYEMTNYLVGKGHRDIAYVGNIYTTSSIQDRFLGYYKSLLEHHIKLKESYVIKDRDEEGTFISMNFPTPLPTAFVCNCDKVAHILIQKLKELGYRVPEDCSVVGFDNDVFATITDPGITTVAVNVDEMAKTAVTFITSKVKNKEKKFGRVLVKGNIVYRESVAELTS